MTDSAEKQKYVVVDADDLSKLLRAAVRAELNEQAANDQYALIKHKDAAVILGISSNALHKRVQNQHIVPDKSAGEDGNRSNMFSRATLDAYMKRQKR